MELLYYLLPVYTAYFLATASPGPSNLAIMAIAMGRGRLAALALVLGIITGSMSWALLAATGLSTILATYAHAMTAIRIIGGLYLLFLAYKAASTALASSARPAEAAHSNSPGGYGALYRRGLFLHLSNPKAIFTWISIMSLGVQPGMPAYVLPVMLVGCVVLSLIIFSSYALLFSVPPMVALYRKMQRGFEAVVAVFFGYAGLRLLLARN